MVGRRRVLVDDGGVLFHCPAQSQSARRHRALQSGCVLAGAQSIRVSFGMPWKASGSGREGRVSGCLVPLPCGRRPALRPKRAQPTLRGCRSIEEYIARDKSIESIAHEVGSLTLHSLQGLPVSQATTLPFVKSCLQQALESLYPRRVNKSSAGESRMLPPPVQGTKRPFRPKKESLPGFAA